MCCLPYRRIPRQLRCFPAMKICCLWFRCYPLQYRHTPVPFITRTVCRLCLRYGKYDRCRNAITVVRAIAAALLLLLRVDFRLNFFNILTIKFPPFACVNIWQLWCHLIVSFIRCAVGICLFFGRNEKNSVGQMSHAVLQYINFSFSPYIKPFVSCLSYKNLLL